MTMSVIRTLVAVALLLVVIVPASPVLASQDKQIIRVGLLANQQSVIVSADAAFVIMADGDRKVAALAAKERAVIAIKDGQLTINGTVEKTQTLRFEAANPQSELISEVNRKRYRGIITVLRTSKYPGLTVVNTIGVEPYLCGIIAGEISPDWPMEAVKAQAVAARTYALYSIGKHGDEGYDVCATTDCQVYGGVGSEAPRAIKAVDETKGLVLQYNGRLIPAYFHSSGGGYTENSENVWSSALPFIRGVPDFDQQSPHYRWTKEYKPSELNLLLEKAGFGIGELQAITLSRLDKQPVNASDRGISGRVKTIRLTGAKGSVMLNGNKFRSLLGLSSTLFDIAVMMPPPPAIEVPMTDSYGDHGQKKIDVNLKPTERKSTFLDQDNIHRITNKQQEKVVISGYGYGHGLGLSQWGAKAMAEKAKPDDAAYFQQILKHYYQGVNMVKLY